MKYVKKPIPVEAIQVDKDFVLHSIHYWEGFYPDWFLNAVNNGDISTKQSDYGLIVHTLEGVMFAPWGSYIVKGVDGELYPCREEIFKKTYEEYKENE